MPWTKEQQDQIVINYWHYGSGECPTDHSILDIQRQAFLRGEYMLIAACPRCSSRLNRGPNEDPEASSFRPWTSDEKRQMVDKYFQTRLASCPVCEANIDVNHQKVMGGPGFVLLICPRCTNSATESAAAS